jgi:hypothetical protein
MPEYEKPSKEYLQELLTDGYEFCCPKCGNTDRFIRYIEASEYVDGHGESDEFTEDSIELECVECAHQEDQENFRVTYLLENAEDDNDEDEEAPDDSE